MTERKNNIKKLATKMQDRQLDARTDGWMDGRTDK